VRIKGFPQEQVLLTGSGRHCPFGSALLLGRSTLNIF
jgi:hypothetical protein